MRTRNFVAVDVMAYAPATADAEFAVTHDLTIDGRAMVPKGWIVKRRSGAARIYAGTTAWTTSTVYLKCDTANAVVSLLLIA